MIFYCIEVAITLDLNIKDEKSQTNVTNHVHLCVVSLIIRIIYGILHLCHAGVAFCVVVVTLQQTAHPRYKDLNFLLVAVHESNVIHHYITVFHLTFHSLSYIACYTVTTLEIYSKKQKFLFNLLMLGDMI